MCSLGDINIKQLSAVMDDFEENKLSTNCHTFVRTDINLSAICQVKLSAKKICHYCTANAVIYQWDKWLCFKHWKIERDKEEKKEKFAVQ